MCVCVRVHVDVKENCLCVFFQFKMYHAIPCSPLKQLPVSVHDLCEGDVAGVETGGKLMQLT